MESPFNTETLAKQITVKSAVNPVLWSCVVISLPLFLFSSQTTGFISVGLFIIAVLPILAFIFSYIYLLFKNPNCLRSEDYQLKAEVLKLLGDKDNPLNAGADHVISVVNNPELPAPLNSQPESLEQLPAPKKQDE